MAPPEAEVVIAAAANLAMTQVAVAATDATKTLAGAATDARAAISTAAAEGLKVLQAAAELATKVVTETAAKTLAEFPNIQQDIREIRQAQREDAETTVRLIKELSATTLTRFTVNSDRLTALEKWRWLVVGGAVMLGWLFSNLPALFQKTILTLKP